MHEESETANNPRRIEQKRKCLPNRVSDGAPESRQTSGRGCVLRSLPTASDAVRPISPDATNRELPNSAKTGLPGPSSGRQLPTLRYLRSYSESRNTQARFAQLRRIREQ